MILVTGGHGFIGNHLVNKLLEENHQVRVVDVIRKIPAGIIIHDQFDFVQGDILDLIPVEAAMKGVKIVIHLAAISSAQECEDYPIKAIRTNVVGTQRLIQTAIANKVRYFIFISSAAVYGDNDTKVQVEHSRLVPKGVYGFTKVAGEELCKMYARSKIFNSVILRLFNVYGPGSLKNAVIPKFVSRALKGENLSIKGGYQTRDFIYISDVVEAIMMMVKKSQEMPDTLQVVDTFNIGTGKSASIDRIAMMVNSRLIDKMRVPVNYEKEEYDTTGIFNSCADITKIQEQFEFEPKIELLEGIGKMVDHYMEQD